MKALPQPRVRRLGGNADRQEVGGRLNNRAENSRQPFRLRERAMQRFRRHCQSKFYTACSRITAAGAPLFLLMNCPRARPDSYAENRLYLFTLTVPSRSMAWRLRQF